MLSHGSLVTTGADHGNRIYETLRLYPSVPLGSRAALKDDVWPDGTRIKKRDVAT